ncbi:MULTISPECIES: holin family protein [unclassified Rhodosalinus]|uniref:holin family protein n=1 Tax=unclassified Rhodosalinus TaxID=2630183 RepID=UPI0035231B55
MGLIGRFLDILFGGERNVLADTAEVFRVNAEAEARRNADFRQAALAQFAAEFALPRRGRFDRFIDAANRIPRPAMALGTLALFGAAMASPVWFAERMQGLAVVPEPLWWLLGAIVSFYFGARHQAKGQEFQREAALGLARAHELAEAAAQRMTRAEAAETAETTGAAPRAVPPDAVAENAALAEWRALRGAGATS